jgi:hypothetical protein
VAGLKRFERWALVGLFLLAFLPRAIYPVSRSLQWYFRSAEFFQAVLHGNWTGTLFSEHPGVTVMWLSGAALWGWYGARSLLGLHPPTPLDTEGYAFADRVTIGVLPLALLVALGILWGWYLLRRLFGRRVAWVAALLWALDPFYLANSKVLHLDATLSTLMMLSALLMLIYLREGRLRQLVVSALLGGLAVLTKISALFLVPFLGLCLLVGWLSSLRSRQSAGANLLLAVRSFLLWILIAAAVCFLLWPSFWVQPGATLDVLIQQGIVRRIDRAHSLPRFHRGVLTVGDPGAQFYVDATVLRTTFLTLPFSLVGLGATLGRRRGRELPLLAGFALFYFAQMALASRKEERYLLPVILALDVLAAWGMTWWAERVRSKDSWPSAYLTGLLLVAQAVAVLPRHPYYGTHYNSLLGGAQAARRVLPLAEFGEGLDLAGRFVEQTAETEVLVIGTQFLANEMLVQYVSSPVHDIVQTGAEADVLVFGVQYTMRGENYPRWGALWDEMYKFREPEFEVSFDGIPYAWVHRPGAEPAIPLQVNARLGDAVRLVGYRLAEQRVSPGDALLLTLYWQAERPVEGDYVAFAQLQGPDGQVVAHREGPPARGERPTDGWVLGNLVEDPYELVLPPDVPYGDHALSVGMYDPATLERLPAFDAAGQRLGEDRVVLATVEVRPLVPWWRWALTGTWLALILVGIVLPWVGRRV